MSRVEVDREICIGMGMCEGISAAFRVGDSGTVDIGDTAALDPLVLRRACLLYTSDAADEVRRV